MANSALAVSVFIVLLAILNEVRSGVPALVPRLVLRSREATRAASVLVAGLFVLLLSHIAELYGDFGGSVAAEAAHEVVETISLTLLLASQLWFWRIVRAKVDPGTILRIEGNSQ